MLNFVLTNQKYIILILGALLGVQGYLNYSLYNSNTNLQNVLEAQLKEIKAQKEDISVLKEKEKIRESEILKWKEDSLKKDAEISKVTISLMNAQSKLDKQNKDYWDQKIFQNICEKDVDILKKHAIEIKGKWK